MVSPYVSVPPRAPLPPPPPPRYRRSLVAPVILILIGVLFLLRNVGVHLPVWHFFGRFWPVLIILWGVFALIEHFAALKHGYRTRGLGGGGVLLLILIVIVGLAAHHSSDLNWEGMRDQIQIDDNDFGGMFGNSYTFEESVEQQFPGDGTLRVVSDRGDISITPSDGDNLRVTVHKKLYAKSQDEANKYDQSTKVQVTVNGTAVMLNANTNGAGDHGVRSDLEIFVPRKAALDIASKRGDVTINDRRADVKLSVQGGDVTLNDVDGSARINMDKKGTVRATGIGGDIDLDGRVSEVNLEDVKGAVRLNGDFFDEIRLTKIAKAVTFKSARSDISIASVPGDLEISGEALRGSDLSGPMRMVTRSKDIHLEDVRGDLELENTNGPIEIHSADKLPLGRMKITGDDGINLTLPPNAGFELDATARIGSISTDFGSVKVESADKGARANGTVGNGASKIQINADKGDISINKG